MGLHQDWPKGRAKALQDMRPRSDDTYREVGQAHGRASLHKLLLADNPAWSSMRAWVEVDRLMATPEFEEQIDRLKELLERSVKDGNNS